MRHFTIAPSRLAAVGLLAAGLTVSAIAVPGWYWLSGGTGSATEQTTRREQDYETRIALLRAQLDTATSRQFLAQKMVETKVDVLLGQQEELAARYDKLQPLLDRAKAGGLLAETVPIPTPKPSLSSNNTAEAGASSDSLVSDERCRQHGPQARADAAGPRAGQPSRRGQPVRAGTGESMPPSSRMTAASRTKPCTGSAAPSIAPNSGRFRTSRPSRRTPARKP